MFPWQNLPHKYYIQNLTFIIKIAIRLDVPVYPLLYILMCSKKYVNSYSEVQFIPSAMSNLNGHLGGWFSSQSHANLPVNWGRFVHQNKVKNAYLWVMIHKQVVKLLILYACPIWGSCAKSHLNKV